MSNALNHIQKLGSAESGELIRQSIKEKLMVVCTVNGMLQVYDLSFQGILKGERILIVSKKWDELKNKNCAFSLKIGSRVYFFKTKVHSENDQAYINTDISIFELKRRKDIRYVIPLSWPHSAGIFIGSKRDKKMAARILDLSSSGIRLQVLSQVPEIKLNQSIAFSIKVHRRNIAFVSGRVRHAKRPKGQFPTIGVEFLSLTPLLIDKINNVCTDVVRFEMLLKSHKKNL